MTAEVISLFEHLVQQQVEEIDVLERAILRLYPKATDTNHLPTQRQMATWLAQGVWLEGFKLVRNTDDDTQGENSKRPGKK